MMSRQNNNNLSFVKQSAIFLIAFAARFIYLLPQIPAKTYTGSDTRLYLDIAQNILQGNGFAAGQTPTAFVSPLYPLYLSFCLAVFGENILWASVLQCVFSSLTSVLIALTATRLFDKNVGMIAGMIAALYYELILWNSSQLLTEPLYTFFLASAVYAVVCAVTTENRKILCFSLAGVAFGLAGLVRPLGLPIAVSVTVFLLTIFLLTRQTHWKYALLILLCCVLTMLPWGVRNHYTMNRFTLLSLEGGHVFWLGNNPEYDRFEHPDFTKWGGYTLMFNNFPEEVKGKTEVEADQIFSQTAWQHIFAHPFDFVVRGFHKTWNMWRPAFSGSSWKNLLVSWTIYPMLLLLSLSGIWLSLRKRLVTAQTVAAGVLVLVFLTNLLIHFTITGEMRFRVPLWTVLIPFAALTVSVIISKSKSFVLTRQN
ncbi:MAG: glycosyltransferase family 39 protein [Pyrinomonadaceae bacterium]|nr:glycosyltransferase family 39 protein [Pyrinomonadaceae bacterium]